MTFLARAGYSYHTPHRSLERLQRHSAGLFVLPHEIIAERRTGVGRYVTRLLEGEDIVASRQLTAEVYMRKGHVDADRIGPDGILLNDTKDAIAHYIGTFDRMSGELVATGRVTWRPQITVDKLATPFDQLNPSIADEMRQLPPGSVADLGSLAKRTGVPLAATMGVIREAYCFAEDNDIEYLVAGIVPDVYEGYQKRFGAGVERIADEPLHHEGYKGTQIGIRMPIRTAAEIYWHEAHTVRDGLMLAVERALIYEYMRNEVESFQAHGPIWRA